MNFKTVREKVFGRSLDYGDWMFFVSLPIVLFGAWRGGWLPEQLVGLGFGLLLGLMLRWGFFWKRRKIKK